MKKYPKIHSEKKPSLIKYGLPWCAEHDSYAPKIYNPFYSEVRGLNIAQYLCDICYIEWRREI